MSRPAIAVAFLLPDCDLACPFCGAAEDFESMSVRAAHELVLGLAAAGVASLVLGGGEPTLWPHDPFALAREAHRRGLEVQLSTNGRALPPGFAEEPAIARYMLPLDAAAPALHDRLRASPGHHALVWRRLTALAAAGKPASVATVVTAENAGDLPALAAALAEHARAGARLHSWHLYRFTPTGRAGARHAARFALALEAFDGAVAPLADPALPFRVYRRRELYASRRIAFVWQARESLTTARGALATEPWWPSPIAVA